MSASIAPQVLLLWLLVFSTIHEFILVVDAFTIITPKIGRSSTTRSGSYRCFQHRSIFSTCRNQRGDNDEARGIILRAKKFASISTDGDGNNNNNVRFTGSLGKPSRTSSKTTQKTTSKNTSSSTMSKKERQRTANGTMDSNSKAGTTTTNHGNPADQAVQVVKGNRGTKTVTIIRGMSATLLEDKKKILKQIKSKMGVGGTLVDGVLEIQGSHAEKVVEMLRELGYAKARKI